MLHLLIVAMENGEVIECEFYSFLWAALQNVFTAKVIWIGSWISRGQNDSLFPILASDVEAAPFRFSWGPYIINVWKYCG